MKSRRGLLFAVVTAFLAGLALPTIVLWNPDRWQWADRLAGREARATAKPGEQTVKQLWTCGMHPQVIQDHPGNCPICGMKLVPVKGTAVASGDSSPAKKERKIKYWRAPMDPNYISDKPGKSPMGMDLVPVYEDEATETGIHVDPSFLQNFAVRTAVAKKGSIAIQSRTVGILAYNEKNIVSVNTKYEGWIENAKVNYIGEPVRRGDVLFEIYSPQLVTTEQEYLAAVSYLHKLSEGNYPDALDRARALLEATRERLRYWDITDDQIAALRKSGKITRTLQVYSPVSGVVVAKMGDSLEGMKLTPGMNVYKIADLSSLWAQVEVFEYQIQQLRLGQSARITVDAFPGRAWMGRIAYIDPTVNPQTRTLRVYVEIPNRDWKLRPQMYANVDLQASGVSGVVKVPDEAILHSGEKNVVIVEKAKGIFEPREVDLGISGGGYSEVRRGVRAGETIVTSAQFLIDSESNLKEAISAMLTASKPQSQQQGTAPVPAPASQQR